ncbi:MAG TPA: hypothetical protein VKT50_01090 [Candidatus Acidoferrales bacterium]|nr:hypothetical protein [Candidatus Acidoferrales bacterium]
MTRKQTTDQEAKDKMGAPADPGIVPVEQGNATDRLATRSTATAAESFGPNNEQLPERLQNAVRRLVLELASESEISRRAEIRRIKQAHQFWRGLQYLWWSERDQNWHLPFEQKATDESSLEDMPRYEFVTNIYQAFGLSIISVLSQDIPRVRFFPQSAESEADVSSAKSASEVSKLIERNNRIGNLIVEEAFHLWTGGKVGAYVRYVVDGQRFGFHPETELDERQVKIGGGWICGECGAETDGQNINRACGDGNGKASRQPDRTGPAGSFESQDKRKLQRPKETSSAGFVESENKRELQTDCAACGALLTEENYVPEEVITVPAGVRTTRVANGQEVLTIVGALELKTPPWANEIHEYPFLQWNMEVHQARLRAAYPHAAKKIGAPVASGDSAQYERLARLEQSQGGPVTAGGDFNPNLITFQRTWLRPWAFYQLDDEALRDELLAIFPDGCYTAFAGDVYCESRNENMDDHWRVMHAMPGDGSSGRPALGDALISVQERFNTLSNLQIETYEYGIPPIYADSEVLDFDALQSQTAEPGAHYPAKAKPGQSLAAGFFQPQAARVPPDLAGHAADLMGPVAQFLTGAFPALFGGAMTNTSTASGYAMARDQAMGRIGLVWRRMKFFHADLMLAAVDCFRKNRPGDVEVTLLGPGAAFESKWIRLVDLKGELFSYPETDEQYPTQWADQRTVLMQLMANPDPRLQAVLGDPSNLGLLKRLIGLDELVIPDEESRTKQYREIAQLLQEQPVVIEASAHAEADEANTSRQPDINRPAGRELQTSISERVLPSIVPDEFADNHAVELDACKRWFSSDAGQIAKIEAPAGYANVRAHAQMHEQFLRKQQAQLVQSAVAQAK